MSKGTIANSPSVGGSQANDASESSISYIKGRPSSVLALFQIASMYMNGYPQSEINAEVAKIKLEDELWKKYWKSRQVNK